MCNAHTHIYTALRQARGISLLLIIIMKRLHVEHLPLCAQHDGRSVPSASLHTNTLQSLFFLLLLQYLPDSHGRTSQWTSPTPSIPSHFLGEPGSLVSPRPVTNACFFFSYQSKQMEKEKEAQLGCCAAWQQGLSYRSFFLLLCLTSQHFTSNHSLLVQRSVDDVFRLPLSAHLNGGRSVDMLRLL